MDSFIAGAQVRVAELGDCATCEVTLSQPIGDNEDILEAYSLLPSNYDGWTGIKVIRYEEVISVLKMLDLPEERYDDYYKRLMFFHEQLIVGRSKERDKEAQNKKTIHEEMK